MKKEIKEEVKLEKNKQKKLKVLSKIIYIIAILGKVVTLIVAPIILLCMIGLPILLNKIDVKDNKFIVNGDTKIEIIENENGVSLKYKDDTIAFEDNEKAIIKVKDVIQNNSKGYIIGYGEVLFTISLILLGITFMTLLNLEKLFKNIYSGDTPFTEDNVKYIRKIANLLIALIVVPIILNIASSLVFKREIDLSISSVNITEILFLFSMSYIFEYGYKLQLDSKAKIYGDTEE